MALELSTAGILLKYAVGATRPTTGYTAINGVKSLPDFNPEPAQHDCTPLAETGWHRYTPGLRDTGGAWGITVNDYDDFRTSWTAVMTAFNGRGANEEMWFEIYVPGLTTNGSFFFSGVPSELGFGGAEVDGVYENVAYITPNKFVGWAAHATGSSISKTFMTIADGSTDTATISGFGDSVVLGSSNMAVATAAISSSTITVTAVDAGSATITVMGSNGSYAEIAVTVTA